jgi:hypothetical protein
LDPFRQPAPGDRPDRHALGDPVTDAVARLAPRSAGAIADVELLRVARTSAGDLASRRPEGVAGRIRGFFGRGSRSGA